MSEPSHDGPRATLSPALRATLRAVVALTDSLGYAPTVREIQRLTRASSTSVVAYRLGQLEQRGYLARTPGRIRAMRVLPAGREVLR